MSKIKHTEPQPSREWRRFVWHDRARVEVPTVYNVLECPGWLADGLPGQGYPLLLLVVGCKWNERKKNTTKPNQETKGNNNKGRKSNTNNPSLDQSIAFDRFNVMGSRQADKQASKAKKRETSREWDVLENVRLVEHNHGGECAVRCDAIWKL